MGDEERIRVAEEICNPGEEAEEWVTIKEAAKISGYNPDTIYQLVSRRGRIPAEKREVVVERIHISLDALMEYKISIPSPAERGRMGGRPRKKPAQSA